MICFMVRQFPSKQLMREVICAVYLRAIKSYFIAYFWVSHIVIIGFYPWNKFRVYFVCLCNKTFRIMGLFLLIYNYIHYCLLMLYKNNNCFAHIFSYLWILLKVKSYQTILKQTFKMLLYKIKIQGCMFQNYFLFWKTFKRNHTI